MWEGFDVTEKKLEVGVVVVLQPSSPFVHLETRGYWQIKGNGIWSRRVLEFGMKRDQMVAKSGPDGENGH